MFYILVSTNWISFNDESRITELYAITPVSDSFNYVVFTCSFFIEVFAVQQKLDFFSINWLSTKWEHHLFLRVPNLNISMRQKLHTPNLNTKLPNKNPQNIPTPKYPDAKISRRQNFQIYDISCMDLPSLFFKAIEILAGIHEKIIHKSKYFIVCYSEEKHRLIYRLWVICFMFL